MFRVDKYAHAVIENKLASQLITVVNNLKSKSATNGCLSYPMPATAGFLLVTNICHWEFFQACYLACTNIGVI